MKKKREYETPASEQVELECPQLMAGSPEDEPEQSGTSENPFSGEGL